MNRRCRFVRLCLVVYNKYDCITGVPARFGKGQGAKEICALRAQFSAQTTQNRAQFRPSRERPKFGHNPARERNEVWAQFCGRSMKRWQICKHKHFYIGCLKTQQQLHFVNERKKTKIIIFLKIIQAGRL